MLEMAIQREGTTFQKMVVDEGAFLRGLLEDLSAAVNSEVCVCAVPFQLAITHNICWAVVQSMPLGVGHGQVALNRFIKPEYCKGKLRPCQAMIRAADDIPCRLLGRQLRRGCEPSCRRSPAPSLLSFPSIGRCSRAHR
jgi:hypothetical protein